MSIKKSKQQRLTKKAKADLRKVQTLLNEQIEKFDSTPNEKKRLRSMLYGTDRASCMLYIKEANGETKNVAFDEVKNNHTIDETIEIWESSFDQDTSTLARYFAGFDHVTNHMIGEGLLNEDGSATDKGKLLQERDEGELDESPLNELQRLMEQEPGEEEEEPGEEAPQKKGLVKRALGAVGKVVSAPFKLLKWFKDKIWGFISGAVTKAFKLVETLAEKFDVKWLKALTDGVRTIIDKINSFCEKNKVLSILCGIIKSVLIAYLVKVAVIAFMNAFGISIGGSLMAMVGGCGAAAAAAVVTEERKILNEISGELCNAMAKAGSVATDYTSKMVKGAIKYIGSSAGWQGEAGEAAPKIIQEALNFVDKYDAILRESTTTGPRFFEDNLDKMQEAAKACGSEGAKLVSTAISYLRRTLGLLASNVKGYDYVQEKMIALGDAGSEIQASNALAKILKFKNSVGDFGGAAIGKSAEASADIMKRLKSLGDMLGWKSIGWDNITTGSYATSTTAGVARSAVGLEEHQISRFQHLAKING